MPAAAESKFFNSSSVGIAIMYRIVITYLLVLLLPFGICAQTADFVPEWKVEAQKIADGQYRLRFSTELSNGWQLYAPDQVLLDVPVAQLQFSDSSISFDTARGHSVGERHHHHGSRSGFFVGATLFYLRKR